MLQNKTKHVFKIFMIILFFLSLTSQVHAFDEFDEGDGKLPTVRGPGVWWVAQDPTYNANSGGESQAFKEFYNSQMGTNPPKYKSVESFKNRVNQAGVDATGPGDSLWENCKKSKFIFWYGSSHSWYDSKTKITYFQKSWYTFTSGSNHPSLTWNGLVGDAVENLERYKQWSPNWKSGQIILICSFSYDRPIEKELIFKANSGTFEYDGTPKKVSGLHSDTDVSQLAPGHRYEAVAERTETQPGEYDVTFSKLIIYDANGKDITQSGLYKIKKIPGKLIIRKEEPKKEPDMTTTEDREWRCNDTRSDSASAYTRNTITGYEQFRPTGAPYMPTMFRARDTAAGLFAYKNSMPKRYDSLSDWTYWKNQFTQYDPTSTITEELNLEQGGVSRILSKYGGVYNIEKTLINDTYRVTHCQPQERTMTENFVHGYRMDIDDAWDFYDNDTELYIEEYYNRRVYVYEEAQIISVDERNERIRVEYWDPDRRRYSTQWIYLDEIDYWRYSEGKVWSPWKNIGGRIIWSSSGPQRDYEDYIYQILSVNCNKDGFYSVLGNAEDLSYSNGDGGAILKTRQVRKTGSSSIRLGRTAPTNRDSFYTDGTSCDVFSCTAKPLPDSEDDSRNNKNNRGYFQAEYPLADIRRNEGKYQKLGDGKDYLVFFRDNEDNEVRVDIWYPKNVNKGDIQSFPGIDANGTSGKLYRGSPEIELSTIAPWGFVEDKFTQFGQTRVWNGPRNRFIMKSQWSSLKDQPYQMSLMWEYSGMGKNHVPAKVGGDNVHSMTGAYSYYFNVACPFRNKEVPGANYKGYIPRTPFVNPYVDREQIWNDIDGFKEYIQAIFVRSVSDTQK